MADCTDMTIADDSDKHVNPLLSPPSLVNTALDYYAPKNPFDRQFELARKYNIDPLHYENAMPNYRQLSPLNTPSISLNDGNYISTANVVMHDLIGPSPLIPVSAISAVVPSSSTSAITTASSEATPTITTTTTLSQFEPSKPFELSTTTTKVGNQRSNVVSVICPPVPGCTKSNELINEDLTVKSAPVISEAIAESNKASLDRSLSDSKALPLHATSNERVIPIKPNRDVTYLDSLPDSNTNTNAFCPLVIDVDNCLSSTLVGFQSANDGISNFIKIVPKLHDKSASLNGASARPLSISSPSSRKKEKSEEELLNKLKATEAALPPKAKPGRKSRSAKEEDVKEKKKRSLERNRAAAMRCRLKKKKEVDELKSKVDMYEQQNKDLKRIIESLYKEVRELKGELMRHKDC